MNYEAMEKKENKLLFLFNYFLFAVFLIYMYIGYGNMQNTMDHMLETMKLMLKNTYGMCNVTQQLTTVSMKCYD